MPTIKINEWNGIYNNINPNELSFNFSYDGQNFLYKKTHISFIPYNIISETLPNPNITFSNYTWTWETGLYCYIYDDPFYQTDSGLTPPSSDPLKKCLVLIAKAPRGNDILRLIYLKDLSTGTWYELSKNGDNQSNLVLIENHDGAGNFNNSFFTTGLPGRAIIRNYNGVIKIYLPHDAFIINYYRRKLYYYGTTTNGHNGWYIDRLIEPFDQINTNLLYYNGVDWVEINYNPHTGFSPVIKCNLKRRLQIKISYNRITDQNAIINKINLNKTSHGLVTNIKVPTVGAGYTECKAQKYSFVDNQTGLAIKPNMIPNSYPSWPSANYIDNNGIDPDYFYFPVSAPTESYILLPIWFIETIAIDGSDWLTLSNANPSDAGWDWDGTFIKRTDGGSHFFTWPIYFITKTLFDTLTLIWKEGGKVSDVGIDNKYKSITTIITGLLNDQNEVIIEYAQNSLEDLDRTTYPKFAIKYHSPSIPTNHHRNLTRLRLYVGLIGYDKQDTIEPELIEEWNLLDNKNDISKPVFLSKAAWKGVTLSQNIGIFFDQEKPTEHKLITGFRDITTDSNITLGLEAGNYSNIYASTVGGGNLQPDIIYKQNIVSLEVPDTILAISSFNNKFIAIGKTGIRMMDIVNPESGALQFIVQKTLPFTIFSNKDIVKTTRGIAIHTPQGIIITNGFEHTLISQPINNIIKTYYNEARLFYSEPKQELYYLVPSLSKIYFYSFEYETWNAIDKFQEQP